MHLTGIIQNQVHVLVESYRHWRHKYYCKNNQNQVTSNVPLNAGVDILIQPDTNAGPVLKVPEENLKWTWDKKNEYREPWEKQEDNLGQTHLFAESVIGLIAHSLPSRDQ